MRRRVFHIFLFCALGAGCRTAEVDTRPKDPLLESKKPVERTVDTALPTLVASEPAPPPLPTMMARRWPGGNNPVQAQMVAGGRDWQVSKPAVRTVVKPETIYDHAEDYSALQGILEKHYDGHFELRYCEPGKDDAQGGKVRLDDDPRLAEFHDGDTVRVEGALVPNLDCATQVKWTPYPRYRILKVSLVTRH